MKKIILSSLIFTSLAFSKIVYIESDKILSESKKAIELNKKIQSEFEPKQKEIESIGKNIFQEMNNISSVEEKKQWQEKQQMFQKLKMEFQRNLQNAKMSSINKMNELMIESIKEYRKKHSDIELVIENPIYGIENLNITNDIIKMIDHKH